MPPVLLRKAREIVEESKYRPKFHFTAAKNWINDPNGLLWHDEKYHLYYQHNPFGTKWGHMSWGHATSEDLISWTEHPVAILEDESAGEAIFSGSAVYDETGTAGVANSIVACYTAHTELGGQKRQYQAIAISSDGGFTFEKQGPVLDVGKQDFRDPKVFRYNSAWYMVVAHPIEQQVEILRSQNLREWHHLSYFQHLGPDDAIWECPDLFELQADGEAKWVLIVSLNPGGPQNGSGTMYFIGEFDGVTFTKTQEPKWLDFGRDNYAGVTFNDAPNLERILIGWMNSWGKTDHPELEWTGAMTVPRKLSLVSANSKWSLRQDPVVAPQHVYTLNARNKYTELLPHGIAANYNPESGQLIIAGYTAELPGMDQVVLEVLEDSCSVEIFANNRTVSFTFLVFN